MGKILKWLLIVALICDLPLFLLLNSNNDYQKACEKNNYEKAHRILGKLRSEFVTKGLTTKKNKKITQLKGYQDYVNADVYIFREEVSYLMSINEVNAENRIIKLILETPLDGKRIDAGEYSNLEEGYISHQDWFDILIDGFDYDYNYNAIWLYYYCIKRYNQKCDIALDLSIIYRNNSLAKRILPYYKETMHIDPINNYDGKVWYDNEDRDAAEKRYNETLTKGGFD